MSRKKKRNWLPIILAVELTVLALTIGFVGWKVWSIRNGKNTEEPPVTEEVVDEEIPVVPEKTEEELWEEELRARIDELTLEEKVCQMFMITPEALTGIGPVTAAGETTKNAIDEYPVGGLIYFADNLVAPEQVKTMLNKTQEYAQERLGVPILLSVDEEGGQVVRIASKPAFGVPQFEYLSQVGARGDMEEIKNVGTEIGTYLKELGFNMDQAPDADVISNPENTVVKFRSFSSDGNDVAESAQAYLDGLHSQGILGVYKHFPGHGGTTGDTHEGYAYVESTLEELEERDLIPFKKGIENGLQVIMVGHISCPNVTGDDTPASLSRMLVTELLRNDMGFQGIVITDALNMGAIAEQYSSAEAAVKAIDAGVDLLLMPEDFEEAYWGVLEAVESGIIAEERIDESVYRIWNVKVEKSN